MSAEQKLIQAVLIGAGVGRGAGERGHSLPPIAESHPPTEQPMEVVSEIVCLALKHPSAGYNRLESLLMAEGIYISQKTSGRV